MESAQEFNLSNDVAIELCEFFGRDPVFTVFSRTGYLDGIPGEIVGLDCKAENIAGAAVTRVPVARYLYGITLFENWIEDWLFGKPRRKYAPIRRPNQFELPFPSRSVEGGSGTHSF